MGKPTWNFLTEFFCIFRPLRFRVSIKPEHFLLFFGKAQLLFAIRCSSRVCMRAAMHLNYGIRLPFGFWVTLAQCCQGFLRALLSCLTMQNRKCTQIVPPNEACHYCFFCLRGPKLQKLIHCEATRALNLPSPYITFHIILERGEINCDQVGEDGKNL